MKNEKINQFLDKEAVINPEQVPEQLFKNIARMALKQIKSDQCFKERYEKETGKSIYKRDSIT